ncbi:hypothetical protein DPMN_128312 [Dreissena polymorpha]|uniref:Uncharacterized protein n=1 Tax=Dreissena polymorpha TaxID=45954 RepID=A0A9D4H0W9_DREPO|nr:hypothetical protein DPMN_128312 [Dreissena polymorpha]
MATNCSSDEPPNAGQFAFTFHYVKPSRFRLLYGEITYNMHIGYNANCEVPDSPVVDNTSSVFLHYYRTPYIREESSLLPLSNSSYKFYQLGNLTDDIWGGRTCKNPGSHAPHRDESLAVQCL